MADNRPNQDPYAAPQDPYAVNPGQLGDPYAQGATADPYAPAGQGYDPYAAGPNTFQDKKTGNQTFLIIIVAVIVLLVLVAGVLIYLNFQSSGTETPMENGNTQESVEEEENPQIQINVGKTGGEGTPATLARKGTDGRLSADFISRYFQIQPFIDDDGNCTEEDRCGVEADPDNDGVTNIEEQNFGTDPLNSDTDRDGIADGDELYVYYTNPLIEDSDGDTFPDFTEIANCFDPTADTSGLKMVESDVGFLTLDTIESNVELNPLRSITQITFRSGGASSSDIAKGYIEETCVVAVSEESESESTTGEGSSDTETAEPVSTTSDQRI